MKTEIKQEALLKVCRMACRGQVKRVPPGEGGEETQDWEEMWLLGLWPESLCMIEVKAGVTWRRLEETGPACCGMQAPESAWECAGEVRNGQSSGLNINFKRKKKNELLKHKNLPGA